MARDMSAALASKGWLYHPDYPDDWERSPLYSLAQWVNGLPFRDIQFSPSGLPIIKITEIKGGISGQTKFTEQTFDESVRVRPGDLLFSWSGQPETSIDAFWWRGPEGWLNQHVFRVTPAGGIDRTFFYYLLRYLKPNFVGIARNKQTTGLGHVTKLDLENIEAAYPELPEQRAIAHILGTLDDKIELNRRMSETLEAMARALFKSWFIDFDPVRRNAARARNQPSPGASRHPLPEGEGNYRGGYDFSGLLETARDLRRKQTPAEEVFWQMVRGRQFMGLKFRRQHQLGDYIVDFYCHEPRMVIELDGGVHSAKREKDHKRDAWMKAQGYTVLHFSNEQLLDDPQSVLTAIAEAVFPSPPGRGAGGEDMIESHAFDHLFPARLVPSELGEIPEGWEVRPIDHLAEVVGGSTPKTERTEYWEGGTHHWVTPKDLSRLSMPVLLDTERRITDAGLAQISSGLLPKGTVLLSSRAPIGYLAIAEVPVAINQGFIAMKPRQGISNLFLLRWASAAHEEIVSHANGSTFLEISKSSFRSIRIVAPSASAMDAFDRVSCPMYRKVVEHERESRTLAALRDALLPKLISGELRVKDTEKFIAEAR